METKSLGANIKYYRLLNEKTQLQIATVLNVKYQTVSSWENDKSEPDLENLKKLAKIFEITLDELCNF